MQKVFKLTFLFIGVVIGAGFATGAEIVLFFGKNGLPSVIFSAFVIAVLSAIFCLFGKIKNKNKTVNNLLKIVVFASSIVTYFVMISGANCLIKEQFGFEYFGVITGGIVAILVSKDLSVIKLLNLVIIPLIIVIMLVILFASGGVFNNSFDFLVSCKYAGMNMLLGGYFLADEGESLSKKQIFFLFIATFFAMAILMSVCYLISMQGAVSAMPIVEVARRCGFSVLACVVVYLAIFTTLIGSGKLVFDMMFEFCSEKALIFTLLFVVSLIFSRLEFASLVEFCYSNIGKIGLFLSVFITVYTTFVYTKTGVNKLKYIIAKKIKK